MIRNIYKNVLLLGLVTILLFGNYTAFSQILPSGFTSEKLAPLQFPTAMGIAPDGRVFVCISTGGKGIVRVYKDGILLPTPFITISNVYSDKEKGLVGIVFDPEYTKNGYVYMYYTVDLSNGSQNGDVINRIGRVTGKGDVADASTLTTILDLEKIIKPLVNFNHDGGAMVFGTDGKIYVATGENTMNCPETCLDVNNNKFCVPCNDPITGEGIWDGEIVAPRWCQNMNSYHGKILRINKDGSAPTDNPWYTANGSEPSKRIYAKGVRNPFTMHIRKGTSDLYFNDVGSADGNNNSYKKWEEVNKCPFSLDTLGKNFGFNQGTFPSAEGVVDVSRPEFKGYANPVFAYLSSKNGGTDISKGCAIVGGTFYEPSKPTFPAEYMGKYFFMDFCEGWINYMDADGKNVKSFGTGFAGGGSGFGSFCLEENIDGNLYHLVRSQRAGVSGLYRIKGPIPTGVESDLASNKYAFSVHPNPATQGSLNIHYNAAVAEAATIEIYNQLGGLQKTFTFQGSEGFNDTNFDISTLNKGVYVVKFITANAKASKKLVVQ